MKGFSVPERVQDYGFLLLLSGFLLPWILVQLSTGVSADAAWLTGAAEHFLAGQQMTDAYFDNNPPMSYMIFVPVALLIKSGFPLWTALNIFTLSLAGISFFLLARVLRLWPELSKERYWGILASWALGALLISQHEFGQKDHFIALTILPLLLLQMAITHGKKVPVALLLAIFVVAVPCLLIKPHYGFLSIMVLAHRAWIQRRFSVCFNPDFLALACGVILYGVAIALWFPDFIIIALPNSLTLYVAKISMTVFWASFGLLLLSVCLLVLSFLSSEKDAAGDIAVFLCVMAVAASFVFFLQFKGYGLHMLPALAFILPALFMTVSLLLPQFFKRSSVPATSIIIIGLLLTGYAIVPLDHSYPTHNDYRESSLAQLVREKAEDSSFFMQGSSTNIIVPVSVYTGIPVASRFSSLWFLNGIQTKGYFSTMIARDMERYRPALVALLTDPNEKEDFLEIMGNSETFQREWKNYRKEKQYTLDYREYFTKADLQRYPPIVYDIYIRK